MKTRAAVIHAVGEEWTVQELDLNEPGDNEVRIKVMASGLCHSDDHFVTGDLAVELDRFGQLGSERLIVAASQRRRDAVEVVS